MNFVLFCCAVFAGSAAAYALPVANYLVVDIAILIAYIAGVMK